jgi:DNA helicase-2/ATP-dependent DNA helicase PcrA
MTLHTSKGLEFPLVFMVGCEQGLFPSIRANEEPDPDDIEEERRLCYVGMTRAKQLLYMSHCVSRRIYGNIMYQEPSCFFSEIPAKFVDYHDLAPGMRRFTTDSWGSSEDDAPRYVSDEPVIQRATPGGRGGSTVSGPVATGGALAGKAVKHPNYGPGVIKASEGSGADVKVTVEFKHVGVKKFVLRFAQLEFED